MNTGRNTKLMSNDGLRLKRLRRRIQLGVACAGFGVTLFLSEYSATAINEPPDCNSVMITTNPVSQTVCLGSSVSFSVAATGSLPLYYQWQENGTNLSDGGSVSGSATPTLKLTGLGAGDSGLQFDAIVTNLCEGWPSVATSAVATVTINTNASLTAIIGGIGPVCPQSTNTFSGTSGAGLSYGWSIAGQGTIIGATSSQTVSVVSGLTNSFTLTLTVSSATCTDSTSAAMPITPATAVIYGPTTVCSLSQNLYAGPEGPDLSYAWSISDSGTIVAATSDPVIFVAAGMSGTYTLTLTVSCDSSSSSTSTTVSIYNSAIIVTQPVSQVACAEDLTTFSVAATGSSLTYQWQKNDVNLIDEANISGSSTPTLTISNVGSTASGTCVWYTVNANSSSGVSVGSVSAGQTYTYQASGCAWSDDVLHHSDPNGNQYFEGTCDSFVGRQVGGSGLICPGLVRVSLVGEVGSTCIQLGTNGSFVAPASGTLTLYYNDSSFTDNEGAFSACVTPTSMTDTYDVVVTSGCNFETSVPVTLTIEAPTATVSGSATICSGQSTMIQATLTGTAPWKLTWSDGITQSNIMASPIVRLINPTTTTTYTITNFADAYCTNSASGSATITITSGGTVATPTFSPEGRQYLAPISVTISCVTAGASIHYTTNSLIPTLDDPSVVSGGTISLRQPTMLRARAFTNGFCASDIKGGLYQIGPVLATGGGSDAETSYLFQTNGIVWTWGSDTDVILLVPLIDLTTVGIHDNFLDTPFPAVGISNLWSLSQGLDGTAALDNGGNIWQWGQPDEIELSETPIALPGISNVVGIVASMDSDDEHDYILALKSDGTAWIISNLVTQVAGVSNTIAIAVDPYGDATVALQSDGTVWALGSDDNGIFGDGGGGTSVVTPVQVTGVSNVVAIAYNANYVLALNQDGTVWSWGDDGYGQLGTGNSHVHEGAPFATPMQLPGLSNVVGIAVGSGFSVAVTASGQVYTWGVNGSTFGFHGLLGTGNTSSDHISTPQLVTGLPNVQSVSAASHTLAVTKYQGINLFWGWGNNNNGELGDGSIISRPSPVLIHFPFDTDGEGIPDWQKYQLGFDLLNPHLNNDGLLNNINRAIGFDPLNPDLNSDNYSNAFDITAGVNPFDPGSFLTGDSTNIFPVITLIEPAGAVLIH